MQKKKYKLTTLIISVLFLFFIFLSLLYTYSSGKAIDKIGDLAISIDQKNNQTLSSILFYDITVETANDWSERFKIASNALLTLAENIQNQLTNNSITNSNVSKLNLTIHKGKDFFTDNSQNIVKCYWGGKNNVPPHVKNQLSSLMNISNQFIGVKKLYPEIFYSIYYISTDNYAFSYPLADNYYKNIKNSKLFNKYYVFEKFSNQIDDNHMKVLQPIFSPPSIDITNIITMSVGVPIYDKGKLLGYVGIDFNFKEIYEKLNISKLSAGLNIKGEKALLESFFFLINEDGTIIIFPRKYADLFSIPPENLDLKKYLKPNTTKLTESTSPTIKKLAKQIQTENSGIEEIAINNKNYILAYATIKETNWRLAYVIKNKLLLTHTIKTNELINSNIKKIFRQYSWLIVIFLIFSFIILYFIFRHYVLSPIGKIKKEVSKMGDGNFDIKLKEEGPYEIAELSSAFNYLGKELNDYMENLKTEILTRQAFETEIQIAEKIQRSILPDSTLLPTHGAFQLVSKLNAAKHVSGDFYDFFYISEKKIAIIIADVSGKGLQAAFFMATSKALIKNICLWEPDEDPGNVLKEVNKSLCMDNNAQMFVTVSLTFYNIEDGTVSYANAGHHAAILIRDNSIIRPKKLNNIALGIFEDAEYETCLNKTNINDIIILYTDGVPEAISLKKEEYGEERLEKLVLQNKELPLDKLCDGIIKDVTDFETEARFDDITLVVFKRLK